MYCSPRRCFSYCLPKLITKFGCGSQWQSRPVAVIITILIIIVVVVVIIIICLQPLLTVAIIADILG